MNANKSDLNVLKNDLNCKVSLITASDPVLYSLTEIETEIYIISLSETEMFHRKEMKYKRESEHIKPNINLNEIDFTTKMVT